MTTSTTFWRPNSQSRMARGIWTIQIPSIP
jgi:hypothetical protein